nr:hypothetical protein [Candidatus Freyarchaeota archaeon]
MSRGALLTGTAGGIIGTITAAIGIIWSIIDVQLIITLFRYSTPLYLSDAFLYNNLSIILTFAAAPSTSPLLFFVFSLVLGILLIVSCVLTGVGFYGLYQAGGDAMGVVGLIFGIVGGAAGGTLIILGNTILSSAPLSGTSFLFSTPNYSVIWKGMIMLAVTFILLGSASIVVRGTTTRSGTSVAAGILSIIGACLFFLFFLGDFGSIIALVGFGLIFVAFILWAVVFYSSRNI